MIKPLQLGLTLLAILIAASIAPTALADGDPASDVLPTMDVYFPLSVPSGDAASALSSAVSQVYAGGDRVKVAVIATVDDMGAIPSLFNMPKPYARFLGQELAGFYEGPLLIVMPSGFGIYDGGRSTGAEGAVLEGLSVSGSSPDALTRSAAAAVQKLQSAGALKSADVRPPYVYPDVVTVRPGKTVDLTFRLLDDSEHARASITITSGSKTIASFRSPALTAVYTKQQSVSWPVPKNVPTKGLELCLAAVDGSGNHSTPDCVPIKVKKR